MTKLKFMVIPVALLCALAIFIFINLQLNRLGPEQLAFTVHPAPVKNVSGIAYDGRSLWITEENAQAIHQVDPVSGEVKGKIDFPVKATAGSAWDGSSLWQLAWEEKKIYQVDLGSGRILQSFPSPGQGTCSGLAFDGQYLWVANYEDEKIYRIDQHANGKIIGTQEGNFETTGLAWDGQHLWSGLLVGTKTHDEATPYTGFIQRKLPGAKEALTVLPIPGVGTGGSNWTPQTGRATLLWWFDMFHQRLVQVQVQPGPPRLLLRGLIAALFLLVIISTALVWRSRRGLA